MFIYNSNLGFESDFTGIFNIFSRFLIISNPDESQFKLLCPIFFSIILSIARLKQSRQIINPHRQLV